MARWDPCPVGDYDGRERTIHVFGVPASKQLDFLRSIRAIAKEYHPFVIIFRSVATA